MSVSKVQKHKQKKSIEKFYFQTQISDKDIIFWTTYLLKFPSRPMKRHEESQWTLLWVLQHLECFCLSQDDISDQVVERWTSADGRGCDMFQKTSPCHEVMEWWVDCWSGWLHHQEQGYFNAADSQTELLEVRWSFSTLRNTISWWTWWSLWW